MKRTKEEYIKAAIAAYGSEDIDFEPKEEIKVADANGGVWVSAWVWIADDEDEEKPA